VLPCAAWPTTPPQFWNGRYKGATGGERARVKQTITGEYYRVNGVQLARRVSASERADAKDTHAAFVRGMLSAWAERLQADCLFGIWNLLRGS